MSVNARLSRFAKRGSEDSFSGETVFFANVSLGGVTSSGSGVLSEEATAQLFRFYENQRRIRSAKSERI